MEELAVRVVIIDDHPLYIKGLQALLFELDPDVRTIGVRSVEEAEALDERSAADLVLLDMHLPGTNCIPALEKVKSLFEAAPVVVVSADEDLDLIWGTIEAGASGYIPKTTDQQLTIQALRLALNRGVFLPREVLRHAETRPGHRPAQSSPTPQISERQIAVLQRLLQGKPNKIIARELDIAEGTVKAHLWAIYQALGVATRTQAMARAHELGFVERFQKEHRPGA